MRNENNIYDLIRDYWDWCFENTGKVKPLHTAIYFFAINQFNRFGWKEQIGFPASLAMEATGINTYASYKKALDELIGFGFLKLKIKAKNQHTANVIALSKTYKAPCKALDKATKKHTTKQSEYNNTNTQINKLTSIKEVKVILPAREFYDKEISDNAGKENADRYAAFVELLYGDNIDKAKYENILNMRDQLSYKQYLSVRNFYYEKLKTNPSIDFRTLVYEMNHWNGLKNNVEVAGTLRTFITNAAKKK